MEDEENVPLGPDAEVSDPVPLGSEGIILVVPLLIVNEERAVSVELDTDVSCPVLLESEEFVLVVPFH